MIKSIIVAQSQNNVIGINNSLPWNLPADLKHFKEITMGHHMIMGRKTYESIGKPLPGRTSIVITRNKELSYPGCIMAHSLDAAFAIAKKNNETEAFVIGGTELIKQSINACDRLYLTTIHHDFEGDTFLENLSTTWKIKEERTFQPDEKNRYSYSFYTYIK
ncbi:dihydrofolate reductase [uncultured Cytophaga sp.]|uniref:dihydrofolate reductase n=1 Tax=uncultured Cytophaga sp. TaxID=160238 RepID=UPI00260BC490|nr:dihydrofolate reductase [uncultured Cytophaga sp.]